jgi:hypothetical protein
MRRTHLRGHTNILKRLFVHIGGFNLGLLMRTLIGVGTPRGLQGRAAVVVAMLVAWWTDVVDFWRATDALPVDGDLRFTTHHRFELLPTTVPAGAL